MNRSLAGKVLLALVLILDGGCRTAPDASGNIHAQIRTVLEVQTLEWNAGNLRGFMETYLDSDQIRFAGGPDIVRGRQSVFERYERKYGGNAVGMGKLSFSDLEVTVLASDAAEAFGRWHLKMAEKNLDGVFTLLLRRTSHGWRIVHDHSS